MQKYCEERDSKSTHLKNHNLGEIFFLFEEQNTLRVAKDRLSCMRRVVQGEFKMKPVEWWDRR